ncbi:hypothetical protein DFP72DRAFT_1059685 [Ephemerocybe angulata]|uniref:Prolyl 4-hydroxylase alpha subunit domain-containing protein n=1 Tax=Ephemerocybe angulata TaxID=980116 RepID=A0A8H6IDM8_9AGAR|nr:hypothetical protein DFP72DRAFT_1059685 [Tulosesus angulatus]
MDANETPVLEGAGEVLLTPEGFDLAALFKEACILDCDEYDEDLRGTKREAEGISGDAGCSDQAPIGGDSRSEQAPVCTSGHTPGEEPEKSRAAKKRLRRNERRRKERVHEREEAGRPPVREEVKARFIPSTPILEASIRFVDLPVTSCGHHGRRETKAELEALKEEECTVEALRGAGKLEVEWDGIKPQVVVNRANGQILTILGGRAADPSFMKSADRATEAILKAAEGAEFTEEEREHKRASDSAALNTGIYYGGGATKPGNMANGRHAEMLEVLVSDPDISRIAGFADSLFKFWMPRVYTDVEEKLNQLYERDPTLKKNWAGSVYPCAAFNFGPRVACKIHKDSGNAPHTFCAITALGNYNPKLGGHLYLKELGIFIQFPPGSTILIPSALLSHANTPVAPHEIRVSFTQFVPGGLIRFVDNGFMTENGLRKKSKKLWREKMAEKEKRWERSRELISTLDELRTKRPKKS